MNETLSALYKEVFGAVPAWWKMNITLHRRILKTKKASAIILTLFLTYRMRNI